MELSRFEDTFMKIDERCETVNPRQVKVSISQPIEYPERRLRASRPRAVRAGSGRRRGRDRGDRINAIEYRPGQRPRELRSTKVQHD